MVGKVVAIFHADKSPDKGGTVPLRVAVRSASLQNTIWLRLLVVLELQSTSRQQSQCCETMGFQFQAHAAVFDRQRLNVALQ